MISFIFDSSALFDSVWRHHCHPSDPVWSVVSATWWPHTKPPHQHNLLCFWCLHVAASYLRHQVRKLVGREYESTGRTNVLLENEEYATTFTVIQWIRVYILKFWVPAVERSPILQVTLIKGMEQTNLWPFLLNRVRLAKRGTSIFLRWHIKNQKP